ncbi:MAG: hypothetical protein KC425_17755, partial [Anaerolineales bacterium]|nr:hypothetical protein [Anaerolineales bacterium]
MSEKSICPECGAKLYFGGDGRSRICETCGYKEAIQKDIPKPAELVRDLRYAAQFAQPKPEPTVFRTNVRVLLAQAKGAVQEGNREEAFFCLEKVLHADADDKQCAEAWLWLSQIYDAPAERRACL